MTLLEQLERDEGFSAFPYFDTTRHLTIGFGRNLIDKGITEAEARVLLQADIDEADRALQATCPWVDRLDEVRRAVLVNMCVNMGIGVLAGFTRTLAAARIGLYRDAAKYMLESRWAVQVGDRARRLSRQMETGTWQ